MLGFLGGNCTHHQRWRRPGRVQLEAPENWDSRFPTAAARVGRAIPQGETAVAWDFVATQSRNFPVLGVYRVGLLCLLQCA